MAGAGMSGLAVFVKRADFCWVKLTHPCGKSFMDTVLNIGGVLVVDGLDVLVLRWTPSICDSASRYTCWAECLCSADLGGADGRHGLAKLLLWARRTLSLSSQEDL